MTQPAFPQQNSSATKHCQEFLRFALAAEVLRFGQFQTKAGRLSPYFFNAGLFHSGAQLAQLGAFYADTLVQSGLQFDMLFGPAYKGIPLATATATALALRHQRDLPIAYNRKEAKDHGEGGQLIGAPLQGRVVIIDDVISAGTSVQESVQWIRQAKAELAGVIIALDRQEQSTHSTQSAVQIVQQELGIPVLAIARLQDLLPLLEQTPSLQEYLPAILEYKARYGAL
ncbi:orotate phosphoribosyltransferase [Candidatus Magnetaquicoccus inordinatus]|uniref:orotate phosphoribosyltransferase n=1 Tax=Candidatus Magnetaquicoccus inordinatus TaxID=2496818 RepID=UPI00102B5432|nr:orotate phosphoribosyltransferase [Candidatus Magnetaquicoccus inordinatus]